MATRDMTTNEIYKSNWVNGNGWECTSYTTDASNMYVNYDTSNMYVNYNTDGPTTLLVPSNLEDAAIEIISTPANFTGTIATVATGTLDNISIDNVSIKKFGEDESKELTREYVQEKLNYIIEEGVNLDPEDESIEAVIEFLEGCQEILKEGLDEIKSKHSNKINHDEPIDELVKKHSKTISSKKLKKKISNKDLFGI